MSLKKDNFNNFDKDFMKLAINLAINQKGLTGTNPSVGCVIANNNKIISFAATNIDGRPHAETIALNKNFKKNIGSTVYLTLEPCSHYGLTPPCTKAIIKSGIKKVNYSIEDIDVRSFNKSKRILNTNKIMTNSGLLKKEVKNLYKNYNYTKKNKLPYVIGKLACSSNFYILRNGKFITNQHSRNISHLLRYKNQGILTSYKTINTDNSKLTCRLNGLEKFSPIRLIIDKDLKINKNSPVINDIYKSNTIIFHSSRDKKKINLLRSKSIKLSYIDLDTHNKIDLKKVFLKAYNIGIGSIIIEGGKTLTKSVLRNKLINEFYLFKSKKSLGKLGRNNIYDFKKKISYFLKKKENIETFLDGDKITRYY